MHTVRPGQDSQTGSGQPGTGGIGPVITTRFSFPAAGGGAPGQPHVSGRSRHAMLIHSPARGPLVKHVSPMGIGPRKFVQVGAGGVTVDVEVDDWMTGDVEVESTTIGPQSSSSGHGDGSLLDQGFPPGILWGGSNMSLSNRGFPPGSLWGGSNGQVPSNSQSCEGRGVARPSRRL